MSTESTFPMGRNIEGKLSADGKTLHLTVNLAGQTWESKGPKHSQLVASSEGFVRLQSGHKVGINVIAPK